MSRKKSVSITLEDVKRLAGLSKLTTSRPEEEKLRAELSSILDYFQVVDGVGGQSGRVITTQDAANMRPDAVRPSDPEGVLRGVPHKKGRLVRAPRVF